MGRTLNDEFVTGLVGDPSLTFGPGGPVWGTDLYVIADGTLMRFDEQGSSTVLGTGFDGAPLDLAFGPDGALYIPFFDEDRILRITPEIPPPGVNVLVGPFVPGTGNWTTVPNGSFESGDVTGWEDFGAILGVFRASVELAADGSFSAKAIPAEPFIGPGFALTQDVTVQGARAMSSAASSVRARYRVGICIST